MGKQAKKQLKKKGVPLLTTAQSDAYKQLVTKEGKTLFANSQIKMQRLVQSNPDPNYISIFKNDYQSKQYPHRLDDLQNNQYTYDQKCHRDRHFDKRKQIQTKVAFSAPITANQEYGWREPIDTFPTKFGMKQTFDESLMQSVKNQKAKK